MQIVAVMRHGPLGRKADLVLTRAASAGTRTFQHIGAHTPALRVTRAVVQQGVLFASTFRAFGGSDVTPTSNGVVFVDRSTGDTCMAPNSPRRHQRPCSRQAEEPGSQNHAPAHDRT